MASEKISEPGGNQSSGAGCRANPDPANWRGALLADYVIQLGGGVDDVPGMVEQILTVLSHAEVARGPVE